MAPQSALDDRLRSVASPAVAARRWRNLYLARRWTVGEQTAVASAVDVGVLVWRVRERVGGIAVAVYDGRPDFVEAADARANPAPVMLARVRDGQRARRRVVGSASRQRRAVDVRREVVVVDENPDPRVPRCARGENVQAEVERPILGDVVVRNPIRDRESRDSLAVARLDDGTESAVVAVEAVGTVGSDVEVTVMCPWRMSDVGRRGFVEQCPKLGGTAVNGHISEFAV